MKSRKTRYERQLERKNRKSVTFVTKILGTAATIPACDVAGAARYLRLKTEGGRTASMEVMKEQLTVALQKGLLVKHYDEKLGDVLVTLSERDKRLHKEKQVAEPNSSMAVAR